MLQVELTARRALLIVILCSVTGSVDGQSACGWVDVGGGVAAPVNGQFVYGQASVFSLSVFDDGGGAKLFAGGAFSEAGGVPAGRVASWDGTTWASVGGLVSPTIPAGYGSVSTVHDDGSGPNLFVGGQGLFLGPAGVPPGSTIMRTDGTTWAGVGAGTGGTWVVDLISFDDGFGPRLWAASDGVPSSSVQRWDGTAWSPAGALASQARAFEVFDAGAGPALHAMTDAGLYSWSPSAGWTLVSSLVTGGWDMQVYDDGTGPALYVTGGSAGLPRWDGTAWSFTPGPDPCSASVFPTRPRSPSRSAIRSVRRHGTSWRRRRRWSSVRTNFRPGRTTSTRRSTWSAST